MKKEDFMEWIKALEEVAMVGNLNSSERKRFRVFGSSPVNWVEFPKGFEYGIVISIDPLFRKRDDYRIVDLETAIDLMDTFHSTVNKWIAQGSIDPMNTSPIDYTFVKDWELVQAEEDDPRKYW